MCGRYSMFLRPSQVRAYLEAHDMQVDEAPPDEEEYGPRQSYNFAPGYNGIVYRANTPDWGAGPRMHGEGQDEAGVEELEPIEHSESSLKTKYKLQAMKWGLIPFWTKRNPDYTSMLRTINCRDDSLVENRGMWTTMKQKKRCIVIAQGFYEWLKKNNGKERIPHYIKRKDGKLMCMAGLWDCVKYEDSEEKLYSYTIITTDSNNQLKFLHDRMPVILENGSDQIQTWLDPKRYTWSRELQSLLKPFQGELEIYPVSKDVGKVGNNSPTFIIPINSSENKNNIANFFTSPKKGLIDPGAPKKESQAIDGGFEDIKVKHDPPKTRTTIPHINSEDNAPLPIPRSLKRQFVHDVPSTDSNLPTKISKKSHESEEERTVMEDEEEKAEVKALSPVKPKRSTKSKSSTSNGTAPAKPAQKDGGSQKITSFFRK